MARITANGETAPEPIAADGEQWIEVVGNTAGASVNVLFDSTLGGGYDSRHIFGGPGTRKVLLIAGGNLKYAIRGGKDGEIDFHINRKAL